jgi:hypothetical protein
MMKRRFIINLCKLVLLFSLILYSICVYANDGMAKFIVGHWEGSIWVNETQVDINVDFRENKSLYAFLSFPDRGFLLLPLENLVYAYPKVSFEFQEGNMTDHFEGVLEQQTITGKFSKGQWIGNFTLNLVKQKPQSRNSGSFTILKAPFVKSRLFQEIARNRMVYSNSIPENEIEPRFMSFLYHYFDFKDELAAETILPLNNTLPDLTALSISDVDATREIDFLFRLIKYGYGGYQFFGGDAKFQEAKNKIDREILSWEDEGKIPLDKYLSVITNHLSFIQDGHFRIGGINLCKKYRYYSAGEYIFNKDKKGIYTLVDKKKRYLTAVDGQDPASYIKLALNKEGKIFYQLGTVSNCQNSQTTLDLLFDGNIHRAAVLERQKSYFIGGQTYYHYKLSGIPVIENRSLGPSTQNTEILQQFVSEAGALKKYKVIILDIRSHLGGDSEFAAAWCNNLTGCSFLEERADGQLVTHTAQKLLLNNIVAQYDPSTADKWKSILKDLKTKEDPAFPGWSSLDIGKGQKIHQRNFLVVLMDSYTASAGESFIEYLRQMDNTIFIGTNTGGLLIAGNVGVCQLPYSRLPVAFGTKLALKPDFINRDGLGYLPDIWVDSKDALDYAVRFAKRYLD